MSVCDLPTFPVTYTAGDTGPAIAGTLTDTDISSYTITLHMERPTGVLTKTATIVDGPQGKFSVAWAAGDLVAGTGQITEIQFVDGVGEIVTSKKFRIDVDRQLA